MPTRMLVVPLLERYWLLHAWKTAEQQAAAPAPVSSASSLGQRAKLLLDNVKHKATASFDKQWKAAQEAPQGSFNNRLYTLAQYVLSRVDPTETFLKSIPRHPQSLLVNYPEGMKQALVRRRLRLLAARRQPFHHQRFLYWIAALVPQIPILPLPLPNVTIYYTIWRIVSHQSASTGARVLSESLSLYDTAQRYRLACQLQQLVKEGVKLAPGEWPEQLLQQRDSLGYKLLQAGADLDALLQPKPQQAQAAAGDRESPSSAPSHSSSSSSSTSTTSTTSTTSSSSSSNPSSSSSSSSGSSSTSSRKSAPLPVFEPDAALALALGHIHRSGPPVPEAAIQKLVELYQQPSLLEHYGAALRVCLKTEPPDAGSRGSSASGRSSAADCGCPDTSSKQAA